MGGEGLWPRDSKLWRGRGRLTRRGKGRHTKGEEEQEVTMWGIMEENSPEITNHEAWRYRSEVTLAPWSNRE